MFIDTMYKKETEAEAIVGNKAVDAEHQTTTV